MKLESNMFSQNFSWNISTIQFHEIILRVEQGLYSAIEICSKLYELTPSQQQRNPLCSMHFEDKNLYGEQILELQSWTSLQHKNIPRK